MPGNLKQRNRDVEMEGCHLGMIALRLQFNLSTLMKRLPPAGHILMGKKEHHGTLLNNDYPLDVLSQRGAVTCDN